MNLKRNEIGKNNRCEANTLRINDEKYINVLLCRKNVSQSFDFTKRLDIRTFSTTVSFHATLLLNKV